MICGQYDGYRNEEGVDSDSNTPTFVAGDYIIDNWRWQGVPFHFMTGKKMPYHLCLRLSSNSKLHHLDLFEGDNTNGRIVMRTSTYASP